MTAPHADRIIAEYLTRLETALAPVAPARRNELMDDVRAHIAEARGELANETDADVLNIVDRLGDPAEMAAAEMGRAESPPPTRSKSRILEIAAIALLLLFWPVGVILLWVSDAWTTRDKLIGTLVPPGGYVGALLVGFVMALGALSPVCRTISDEYGRVHASSCPPGGAQTAINIGAALLIVAYLVGPILSAVYLAVRLKRQPANPTAAISELRHKLET